MSKSELMRKIQSLAFAKTETELYLDCHPDNSAALDYYRKINDELEAYVLEYSNKFGPIKASDAYGKNWTWVENSWPWHVDFEEEVKSRVDL